MRILFSLLAAYISLGFSVANAKKIVITDLEERREIIKNAKVWLSPSWINSNLEFSDDLDVFNGPKDIQNDSILNQDILSCITKPEYYEDVTGKNPKFYCDLIEAVHGDSYKIKIKYHPPGKVNEEVYGEVLGTRLLWALGFGADRIYKQDKVLCHGCSGDPFSDKVIDNATLSTPRSFNQTIIEKKLAGDEVSYQSMNGEAPDDAKWSTDDKGRMDGWSFMELLHNLSDDPAIAYEQYVHRDALRLLSAFIHHLDMKPDNNRIMCPAGMDRNGKCKGNAVLYIQDVGSSFGVRVSIKRMGLIKVRFKTFNERPLWENPEYCQVKNDIPLIADKSMEDYRVSEIGRQFLAKLLEGFSKGAKGRQRVVDLFKTARVESKGEYTAEQWADAFMKRVEQVRFPMGRENPDFKCPLD